MQQLTEEARVKHHFTTAYCPWANGTIERLCKEVIRASRALLSEWQMPPTQWPHILNCVQCVLNQSPLERLGKDPDSSSWPSPLQVFTGRKPDRLLLRPEVTSPVATHQPIDAARAREVARLPQLQAALDDMHRDVARGNERRRSQAQIRQNARTRVTPVNFAIGDYVMTRAARGKRHKLTSNWLGPMRVVATRSDLVFDVENLSRTRTHTVHAQRMQPYPVKLTPEDLTQELRAYGAFCDGGRFLVAGIKDVREKAEGVELLVRWEG